MKEDTIFGMIYSHKDYMYQFRDDYNPLIWDFNDPLFELEI